MNKIAGIGEMAVSRDLEDVMITYSLGSCIGVSMFDPEVNIGALIHCMLPLSKSDPEKAKKNPLMYVDTGIMMMLQTIFKLGVKKSNLITKVSGASSILDKKGIFRIGERNFNVLRKVLWKNDILITASDIGGETPRSMFLYMNSGKTIIKSGNKVSEL